MTVSMRSFVSSGIAVASVGAFVVVPMAPEDGPTHPRPSAVSLTAHVQPLVALPPVPSPQQFLRPLNQQLGFHVDLAVDFVVTGAQLIERQLPVPGTLLRDIHNGTPLPVAVGRALQTLAEVELDAGRELVGFAAEYVDFQIRFIANVLQEAVAMAMAVPAAVSELVSASVARPPSAPDPAPVKTVSLRAEAADVSDDDIEDDDIEKDDMTDGRSDDSARLTVSTLGSDDDTNVTAQGEIRSSVSKTTDADIDETTDTRDTTGPDETTDSDRDAASDPDDAVSAADAGDDDQHQSDAAPTGDDGQGDSDSGEE